MGSQTSQHWPGEGSIVSGHRGQASSLQTVRGKGLSQPYAQQPSRWHLPFSIPVMGLAPGLSPHPGDLSLKPQFPYALSG